MRCFTILSLSLSLSLSISSSLGTAGALRSLTYKAAGPTR